MNSSRVQSGRRRPPPPSYRRSSTTMVMIPRRLLLRRIVVTVSTALFFFWLDHSHLASRQWWPTTVVVHAKCSVRDSHGQTLYLEEVLPVGIRYNPTLDSLECHADHSCREFFITGCTGTVTCHGTYSCVQAQLIDNRAVTCAADSACIEAHFYQGHEIWCGDEQSQRSCWRAIMHTDQTVMCVGPNACVAPKFGDRMSVYVGDQGHLRCSNYGVINQVSCRNIIVTVNHSRRACFTEYTYPLPGEDVNHCAVICINGDWSCDKTSIQFKVG